ncbi:MAG: DUF6356 family protein [bacterium]|nr:DUF6356 family protein [bacterium]
MKNPFTKHPKDNGMNYLEHLLFALGVAASGGWIWGVSIVHAFFPFLFKKAASNEIESLHQLMRRHKK